MGECQIKKKNFEKAFPHLEKAVKLADDPKLKLDDIQIFQYVILSYKNLA